jgi:CRP-like cAMP-binding protein
MSQYQNLLLASLPLPISEAIVSASEFMHYDLREKIIEPNVPIKFIHFIESGVMSLLKVMQDGSQVELATIGNEGMLGVPVAVGIDSVAALVQCQVESSAWRIPIEAFDALSKTYPPLEELSLRYAMAQFEQIAQTTGCNQTHSVDKRCAKWILLTHDRSKSDTFPMTQEFLANMLGISRTLVNATAVSLSEKKIISYVRGRITVLNRKALEDESCQCYEALGQLYKKSMDPAVPLIGV